MSLSGVRFGYPDAPPLLQDLELTISPGQLVAFTGPSGSGKSTVLSMIMGWIRPDAGQVRVGGCDPSRLPPAKMSRLIAWVGQEPALLRGTVAENVRLGLSAASDDQVASALAAAGIELDLHRRLDEASTLSAGEKRRLALARAWLRVRTAGASVMILDEPTAGLDEQTELQAIEAVRALGVTTVMVSHRPAVLAAADRVVRLERP